jgi:MFS transporter, OPA family, glycerol-3-phosphate transporter
MTPRRGQGTRAGRDYVLVALTLHVAYASLYLCRSNFEAANPLLQKAYGFTDLEIGSIASAATFTYAIGKVVLGTVGDVVGGRRILLVAMFGSVLASFAVSTASGLVMLTVLASTNRFFQAGGWGGLVHVVSRWFAPAHHGRVMGALSTSYEIGNALTFVFCGALVSWGFGWRDLFRINPLLVAAAGFGVALLLRGEPPPDAPSPGASSPSSAPLEPREPLSRVLAALARRPAFWATAILSMALTFVRQGFLTWTAVFLTSVGGGTKSAISGAIVKSALFPASGVVAALVAGFISDRLGPGRRAPVMAVSLTLLVGAVLVLAHVPTHDTTVAALRIALCGLFLLGPYSLLAGALTLDVAGKRGTATAAGIVDGVGYFGASLSGVVLGGVAQKLGWPAAFDVVAAVAAVAALISVAWVLSGRLRKIAASP